MQNIIKTFAVAVMRAENWVNGQICWDYIESDVHFDHGNIDNQLFDILANTVVDIQKANTVVNQHIAPIIKGGSTCNSPLTSQYEPHPLVVRALEIALYWKSYKPVNF